MISDNLVLIYLFSFAYLSFFDYLHDATGNSFYEFLKRQFPGQMTYFISGVILLAYLPKFRRYMRYIFPVSVLLFFLRDIWFLRIFEPLALASIIISVAYSCKWLHFFNRMGNFSYGIFLLHFPLIQVFIQLGLAAYNWLLTLALTTVICTYLGYLSWKYIEKPNLYHK